MGICEDFCGPDDITAFHETLIADDEDIQVAVFVVFLNAGFRCRHQFMHAEEGGGRKKLLQSLIRGQWHLLRHDPQW